MWKELAYWVRLASAAQAAANLASHGKHQLANKLMRELK
jgi:hypothetical protein